jgi:hypothetical protein
LEACERLALEQGLDTVDSWPLGKALHQSLLHGLREDVSKSLDLGGVFLGDHGHLVPPVKDGPAPIRQTVDLPGELRLRVPHEVGNFPGVVDDQEEVKMTRKAGEGRDRRLVAALGSPEDEIVERGSGPEQEATLDGAAGGDEGPGVGHEAKFSGHTLLKTEKLALILQGVVSLALAIGYEDSQMDRGTPPCARSGTAGG